MLDTTPLLIHMFLQLHAYESYSNNYTLAEPHADNLELLYLPSTNIHVYICIKPHLSVNDNGAIAVF